MECNNATCESTATRIMGWQDTMGRCLFCAPFCDDHAEEIRVKMRGLPVAGPALSEEAKEIEGVRS